MTPDEAREDLLMRLRAEIEYLDSQAVRQVAPDFHKLGADWQTWAIFIASMIFGFFVCGLIAAHLVLEVLKRLP